MAEDKFLRVVGQNWIHNNPVTVGDVKRRKLIYGPVKYSQLGVVKKSSL